MNKFQNLYKRSPNLAKKKEDSEQLPHLSKNFANFCSTT